MTLENFYYAFEIVGVTAVLASLLFVGIQIRDANRLSRTQMTQDLRSKFLDLMNILIEDPKLAKGVMALENACDGDNDELARRSVIWIQNYTGIVRGAYEDFQKGLIDDWALRDVETIYFLILNDPVAFAVFKDAGRRLDPTRITENDRNWAKRMIDGTSEMKDRYESIPVDFFTKGFVSSTSEEVVASQQADNAENH